jgi:hypothetical protein
MKEEFTKKIYYKKFNHRLVIKCRTPNGANKKLPSPEIIQWSLRGLDKASYRGITSNTYSWSSYSITDTRFTLFFKDPKVKTMVEGVIGAENIETFERPMDEAHTDMLMRDKVVVRKSLFFGKFGFVMRASPRKEPGSYQRNSLHIQEMLEWCKDHFGTQRSKDWKANHWHNASFFFREANDAMLFKLTFGEDIDQSEKIVLVKEMEAQRAST